MSKQGARGSDSYGAQRPGDFGGARSEGTRVTHKDVARLKKKARLKKNMKEVFANEPSTVTRANVSKERKQKMKVAIAYAKTRKSK